MKRTQQLPQPAQRHARALILATFALTLSACSSIGNTISNVSIWPFAGPSERAATPPNGVEYRCIGGQRFYLRYLDNNAAAWVILPEREFRLDRDGATSRYVNGANLLTVEGETLALTESGAAANAYSGCKAAAAVTAAGGAGGGFQPASQPPSSTPAQSPRP